MQETAPCSLQREFWKLTSALQIQGSTSLFLLLYHARTHDVYGKLWEEKERMETRIENHRALT